MNISTHININKPILNYINNYKYKYILVLIYNHIKTYISLYIQI